MTKNKSKKGLSKSLDFSSQEISDYSDNLVDSFKQNFIPSSAELAEFENDSNNSDDEEEQTKETGFFSHLKNKFSSMKEGGSID